MTRQQGPLQCSGPGASFHLQGPTKQEKRSHLAAAVNQKHVRSSRDVVAVFQSEVSRGGKRFQDKTKTVPKTLLRFTKPASVSSVNRKVIWIVCRCAKSVVIRWPASAAVSSTDFSKEVSHLQCQVSKMVRRLQDQMHFDQSLMGYKVVIWTDLIGTMQLCLPCKLCCI